MVLDFKELESAFGSIEALGMDELTFPVDGKMVTLRALLPTEEVAIQRTAKKAFETGEQDMPTNIDYLDRFKVESLAYSLVKSGDLDLHGVLEISTGEKTKEGVPITIQKHVAMRQLLQKWGRPIINAMFRKLGELADKVEAKADKAVVFEPSDLEAERDRLKLRLEEIEKEIQERVQPPQDPMRTHFKRVEDQAEADMAAPEEMQSPEVEEEVTYPPEPVLEETPEPILEAPEPPRPATRRVSAIPLSAPPPGHSPQARVQAPEELPTFLNPEDYDEAEAMLAAEHARQLRLLQQRAAIAPTVQAPPLRVQPPHLAAAEASQEIQNQRPVAKGHTAEGMEVYEMPSAPLLPRTPVEGRAAFNQNPGGQVNQRFQRPPRP